MRVTNKTDAATSHTHTKPYAYDVAAIISATDCNLVINGVPFGVIAAGVLFGGLRVAELESLTITSASTAVLTRTSVIWGLDS